MRIEAIVQSRLASSSELIARVPLTRIRTEGEHVQMDPPYIVHGAVQERSLGTYDENASTRRADYELTVCAQDLDEAYEISDLATQAVTRSASDGAQFSFQSRTRQFDLDARLWVMTTQYSAVY